MISLNSNIAACVVWYNPRLEVDVVKSIKSYSDFVDTVYIVDNSNNDNSILAKQIENSVYIPLTENTGIAHALNVGLGKAIDDGYEWCMTMDQDSAWETDEIIKYIRQVPTDLKSEIKSIYPIICTPALHSRLGNIKAKIAHKNLKMQIITQSNDRWQCSGNIINLKVWSEIGKFNEKLFIDEVDFEFCIRFIRAGYKSQNCDAVLSHQIGMISISPFGGIKLNLSDFRLFYKVRNRFYILYKYPIYAKKYSYKKRIYLLSLRYMLFGGTSKSNIIRRCHIIQSAYRQSREIN